MFAIAAPWRGQITDCRTLQQDVKHLRGRLSLVKQLPILTVGLRVSSVSSTLLPFITMGGALGHFEFRCFSHIFHLSADGRSARRSEPHAMALLVVLPPVNLKKPRQGVGTVRGQCQRGQALKRRLELHSFCLPNHATRALSYAETSRPLLDVRDWGCSVRGEIHAALMSSLNDFFAVNGGTFTVF